MNNQAIGSNSTIGGEGGAIYAGVATGSIVIVNSTFANKTAVGPICVVSGQSPTICGSTDAPPIFSINGSLGSAIAVTIRPTSKSLTARYSGTVRMSATPSILVVR